ncbi:MAG TPA: HlyD family efflux transporter periplasmic adaptor subunit [Acidisarcina sp.]
MNLSEALDAALPELPKTRSADGKRPPRLDPDLIIREDILDGLPSISVLKRSSDTFVRLTPTQWELVQLFDGVRTYEEIASASETRNASIIPVSEVRDFARSLEECNLWYQSPQDKNLALREKLAVHRNRRTRSKFSIANIAFSAWDPDKYLTALDRRVGKYIYSPWFTTFAVLLFLFQVSVFIAKWSVIGPDVPLYYNFTQKSLSDLVEFWLLFFVLGFLHESAHGLTCKHFGGEVHSMGFLFLYLTPAFYCDVTEVWISATRVQRLATIIAGIWIELVLCGIATLVWTNTHAGEGIHDFCYKIILLTGIAVVVINLNPLIKLDGYYFLTEWIRIPDLKERSTGFLMAWLQRSIFRMPAEIPLVSRKRIPLFVCYAILSGIYSYLLLYAFLRFSYNVFYHWFAELAFLPAGALAFIMFRSRLRSLKMFLLSWYRTHIHGGILRPTPFKISLVVSLALLLLLPIWRDRESVYFIIEPIRSAVVHAGLTGRVAAVFVREGQAVATGQVLARLDSPEQASWSGADTAQLSQSRAQLMEAEVRHSGLGDASTTERGAELQSSISSLEREKAAVRAPFAGVILTSDPEALKSSDVAAGDELLTMADSSHLIARIFLPAPEMAHIHTGFDVALMVPSTFSEVRLQLGSIEAAADTLPAGVIQSQQFKGIELPSFYSSRVPLDPAIAGQWGLRPGMSGVGKVFGPRRSLAERIVAITRNFLHTHVW